MEKISDSDVKPLVTISEENSSDTTTTQVKISVSDNVPADDEVKKIIHTQVQDQLEKIGDELESQEAVVVSSPTQDTNKKLLEHVTRTRVLSADSTRRLSADKKIPVPQGNKLSSRASELERVFEKDEEEDLITLSHQITDMIIF